MRLRLNGINPFTGQTVDGIHFLEGKTSLDIVLKMKAENIFTDQDNVAQYIKRVTDNLRLYGSIDIYILPGSNQTMAQNFITGLALNGLVQHQGENQCAGLSE